jgi:integrase
MLRMVQAQRRGRRPRGAIETLPSGSLRVKVYAGYDPVSGKRHYLDEVVRAGPRAAAEAEKVRTRLLHEVDERRNPKTRVTVNQLLDRYMETLDVEPTTRTRYEGIIRVHVRPALGSLSLSKLDGDVLDRFFGQLRRCRERCNGRARHVQHRTQREHDCDERCAVVPCRPLSASSIRQTHWVLNGAFAVAARWRWIGHNPLDATPPPPLPASNPSPPSPAEAARLLDEAWKDPEWGAFVWTAMTTGARRGELCALKIEDVDLDARVMHVRTGLKLADRRLVRRDTKTHQQRRIALDDETVTVLVEHLARADERAAQLGVLIGPDAYLFSLAPDCSTPLIPDTATQRYDRMAKRLGIRTPLHKLRHYSATELIAAGVDIRTIAGRLGHGGGGTTTLKVYAAWVSEADQRAAQALAQRLPRRHPPTPVMRQGRQARVD